MADDAMAPLKIEPARMVTFYYVPAKKRHASSINIKNNLDKWVSFKVKTNNPNRYAVAPPQGILRPLGRTNVRFVVQEKGQARVAEKIKASDEGPMVSVRDEFLVQSIVLSSTFVNEEDVDIGSLWERPATKPVNNRIKCQFAKSELARPDSRGTDSPLDASGTPLPRSSTPMDHRAGSAGGSSTPVDLDGRKTDTPASMNHSETSGDRVTPDVSGGGGGGGSGGKVPRPPSAGSPATPVISADKLEELRHKFSHSLKFNLDMVTEHDSMTAKLARAETQIAALQKKIAELTENPQPAGGSGGSVSKDPAEGGIRKRAGSGDAASGDSGSTETVKVAKVADPGFPLPVVLVLVVVAFILGHLML